MTTWRFTVVFAKLPTFHASGFPGNRGDALVLGALLDQPRKGLLDERWNRPAPRERMGL
jgi:hypothetical protein